MRVTGSFLYKAQPEIVYTTFTDRDALLHATPGLYSLTEVAPDQHEAVLKVGIGGFALVYHGKLKVCERVHGQSYRLLVDATTHNGAGKADATFSFLPHDRGGTRVEYEADVELNGAQKLLPTLARGLVDFFMRGMAEWIDSGGKPHAAWLG